MKKRNKVKSTRKVTLSSRKVKRINTLFAQAYKDLEASRVIEAGKGFQSILDIQPDNVQALLMLAIVSGRLENFAGAIACLQKAIMLEPGRADLYQNLAVILYRQNSFQGAEEAYLQASRLDPQNFEVWFSIGYIRIKQYRIEEAIIAYEKSIELGNRKPQVYVELAKLLLSVDKLERAEHYFSTALENDPDNFELYRAIGTFYVDHQMYDRAIKYYERLLSLHDLSADERRDFFYILQDAYKEIISWEKLREVRSEIIKAESADKGEVLSAYCRPLSSIENKSDYQHNYNAARLYLERISKPLDKSRVHHHVVPGSGRKNNKIIVGYLSPDFRNHPVGQIFSGLIKCHDKKQFEIHCYSYGMDDESSYRSEIEKTSDKFFDIRQLNYRKAADLIHDNKVDILVDLAGYTTLSRMQILFYRPAPIQISYLGFPGTTGADFIDYIVGDKIVIPEYAARYFSEKCIYLPDSYFVYDNRQKIGENNYTRADFDLPETGVVFACFCRTSKIEPDLFDAWLRILARVPDSVLWLASTQNSFVEKIKVYAARQGLAPERIIFAGKLATKADHLARVRLADLALDTVPYNGHTTTCDVLWAGVPVLTTLGTHFASRVSASILYALEIPELICENLEKYEEQALYLATNPALLKTIRAKINNRRDTSSFFDTAMYVKKLEAGYRQAWNLYLEGRAPESIEV